jgi:hypothetical protein
MIPDGIYLHQNCGKYTAFYIPIQYFSKYILLQPNTDFDNKLLPLFLQLFKQKAVL